MNKGPRGPRTLTLYSRRDCHLCDDMLRALSKLQAVGGFVIDVVDVDVDLLLKARYGDRVPVLTASGSELCHYRLDLAKVNEYLSENR